MRRLVDPAVASAQLQIDAARGPPAHADLQLARGLEPALELRGVHPALTADERLVEAVLTLVRVGDEGVELPVGAQVPGRPHPQPSRVGRHRKPERPSLYHVGASEKRRVHVARDAGVLAAPGEPRDSQGAHPVVAELERVLVRDLSAAGVQVIDQDLAVDPGAAGDAPARVERGEDVVAVGAQRIGLLLEIEPLHQDVRNRAQQVERLPPGRAVPGGLGDADPQRLVRLPLDSMRSQLLARRLLERRRQRHQIESQRVEMRAHQQPDDRRRRARQHQRTFFAGAPVPPALAELHGPALPLAGIGDVRLVGEGHQIVVGDDRVGERAGAVEASDHEPGVGEPVVESDRDP